MPATIDQSRILVVDDEAENVRLVARILSRAGYPNVRVETDARQALPAFDEFAPDLVLLDLHMPYVDGFTLLERIRGRIAADAYVPVLVLTGDITPAARRRALSSGARDFLTKPLEADEILLRIRNLLETRMLHVALQEQKHVLEEKVVERTAQLEQAHLETLERLARAAEYRDYDTGRHAQRVGDVAAMLAASLGKSPAEVELVRLAAPLHDIGKIGISDTILLKPGKLTAEEYRSIKAHAAIGAAMLSGSQSPVLRLAETIARYHHERWDGTGYGSLRGEETPLMARIVAVVDVFDGLTHPRPYRGAWSVADSVAYIRDGAGSAFDPAVVEAFLRVLPKIPPGFFEQEPSPLSADAAPEEEPGTASPRGSPA